MAVEANRVFTPYDDDIRLWWWDISNGETPNAAVVAGFPDCTFQVQSIVSGTPTVIAEGTLQPADQNGLHTPVYDGLEDPSGNAISMTAADSETIKQAMYALRPRVSAGTGRAVVYVLASRARR